MNIIMVLISFFVAIATFAEEKFQLNPELKESRVMLLDFLAKQRKNAPQVVILNGDGATDANLRLLEFFRTQYHPFSQRLLEISTEYRVYHLLVSRALYESEAEKKEWMEKTTAANNLYDSLQSSAEYKTMIKKFGNLAANLDGDLAEMAKKEARELDLISFNEKELALSNKINELALKVQTEMHGLPSANDLAKTIQQNNQIDQQFHDNQIDFKTAWQQKEALMAKGYLGHSNQVAKVFRDQLNEIAILRTQLAQSKGFKTWAQYVFAMGVDEYAPGLKTVKEKKQLLQQTLQQLYRPLAQALQKYYSLMSGEKSLENFRLSQVSLVLPPGAIKIRDYFPKGKLVQIWRQTMLESGFADEDLDRVLLDIYPRDRKEKGAYMAPITTTRPQEWVLDARTLALVRGNLVNIKAQTAIVQNFNDNGLVSLSTMFHEGGHHLHYTNELPHLVSYPAYGFVETHSMFMERFLADREFLLANGLTEQGVKITPEQVDLYLQNKGLRDLVNAHGNIISSLYDIEIWDRPFTTTSMGFVEYCITTSRKISQQYDPLPRKVPAGLNPFASNFASSHFISGSVRYMGYFLADFAALKVRERVLDIFQQQTGRRSLFQQPQLAKLLIEGLYQDGTTLPFPRNIERFTQSKYRAADYVRLILAPITPEGEGSTQQRLPNSQCDVSLSKATK